MSTGSSSSPRARPDLKGNLGDDNILREPERQPGLPAAFNVYPTTPTTWRRSAATPAPPNSKGEPEPFSPLVEDAPTRARRRARSAPSRERSRSCCWPSLGCCSSPRVRPRREHDSPLDLRAPARGRGDEPRRRDPLAHPLAVHHRGPVVGLLGAATAVFILWLGKVTIVDPLSDRFALVAALSTRSTSCRSSES